MDPNYFGPESFSKGSGIDPKVSEYLSNRSDEEKADDKKADLYGKKKNAIWNINFIIAMYMVFSIGYLSETFFSMNLNLIIKEWNLILINIGLICIYLGVFKQKKWAFLSMVLVVIITGIIEPISLSIGGLMMVFLIKYREYYI